jgi:hypothetical protein
MDAGGIPLLVVFHCWWYSTPQLYLSLEAEHLSFTRVSPNAILSSAFPSTSLPLLPSLASSRIVFHFPF